MSSRAFVCLALIGVLATACAPERPSDRSESLAEEADRETEAEQRAVAVVDGEKITLAEFERRIQGMAPFARARYSTIENRKEYLDGLVAFELLVDEAERRGLGDDPAVLHAMKDTMVRRLLADEIRARVDIDSFTEEELKKVYKEQRDRFSRPEQRRAAIITLETEARARELFAQLDAVERGDLQNRINTFRRAAASDSSSPESAKKGGDVGFLAAPEAGMNHIEVARRAFELVNVGDIAEPYKHQNKWYLVMMFDKRSAQVKSFDSVSSQLRKELYEKRRQEAKAALIAELRAKSKVEIFEDKLAEVKQPEGPATLDATTLGRQPVRALEGKK